MSCSPTGLAFWTKQRIEAACGKAYRSYEKTLKVHYTDYFARYPRLRCSRHPYSAATVAAALPSGWEHLGRLIPTSALHRYARSGRSSQLLALALLGSCSVEDPSLGWLLAALGAPDSAKFSNISPFSFEYPLEPSELSEYPRVTTIDYVAKIQNLTVIVECKWSERGGFGQCSCLREDGNPAPGGQCASRVQTRRIYWEIARSHFGIFPDRDPTKACRLSVAYQAVGNVAAARALSYGSQSLFVLLFDHSNPYFRRTGDWPGWPAILEETLGANNRFPHFSFRALSWQQLVAMLPLPPDIRKWAIGKHRLG